MHSHLRLLLFQPTSLHAQSIYSPPTSLAQPLTLPAPPRSILPLTPLSPPVRVTTPPPSRAYDVVPVCGRARVRHGLQVVGAELASERWNISVTTSKRRGAVTVTAYGRPGPPQTSAGDAASADG